MPKKGKPLSLEQVAVLEEWIEAGAVWPDGRVLKDEPERDLEWWVAPSSEQRSKVRKQGGG